MTGQSPITRFLFWAIVACTIGLALGVSVPWALKALIALADAAPEKLPWVGTRLFAFLGFFAIAGSVIYGLLLSTKILDRIAHRPVTYTLHKDLSLVGLGLSIVHVLLLGIDSSVPFSITDMLVPFGAPYRPLWVGIGQIGLYVTAVVVGSFYVRRTIGQRAVRLLHYLTFGAFLATSLHGIFTGSDTATTWAWWAYTIPVALVIFLLTYRIIDSAATRDERRAAAEAAAWAAANATTTSTPGALAPRSARRVAPAFPPVPGARPRTPPVPVTGLPPVFPPPPLDPLERRAPRPRSPASPVT